MTDVPNLFIIYSGPFPPNPAELLGGKQFRGMLQALRQVYDYVIIDTPPLGSVIDGAIVAGNCDGAVLVIESGVISYRFAQSVTEQLARSNCPVLRRGPEQSGRAEERKILREILRKILRPLRRNRRDEKVKGKITFLLIAVSAVLIAVNAVTLLAEDRRAPEIIFPQNAPTYRGAGMDEEQLLQGVTASDNREGDVTDRCGSERSCLPRTAPG